MDIEALKQDPFQSSFLDNNAAVASSAHMTTKDAFLTTFLENSQKVVRKIDTLDKRVEKQFESLVLELAVIHAGEEFLKETVKKQGDFAVQDVF